MKVIYFGAISLLVCFTVTMRAQSPNWQWATGPIGLTTVLAVGSDAKGDAYITGHFLGSAVFGNDTITDGLGPYQEVFVAKYDAQGNALWAKNAVGYADAFGVSADDNGNVYVVGDFYNDSMIIGDHVLINPMPGDQVSNIFFAKYDSLGNVAWAKNLGGINNDEALGISTDINGNVYVTGNFIGDSLSIDSITVQHLGNGDGFVAKFNASGNTKWIRSIGSPGIDGSTAVCTDAQGDVFMTGYFISDYVFLGSTNNYISSPYAYNIFITKYDSSGNMRWAKYAGGNNGNSPTGIAADASGNVYVTGYYSDTMAFGNDTLIGPGLQNIFTAKYDTSGNVLWAQSAGGTYADQANAITTDENGNSYVTGYFQSDTAIFGNTELFNYTFNQFAFVVKYNTYGNVEWAIAPGGTSVNAGIGISYNNGSVYVTGTFQSSDIIFGNDTLSDAGLTIFLAKSDTSLLTGIIPVNNNLTDKILVYPNPSGGSFNFKGVSNGNVIEVYNLFGQSVSTATINSSDFILNLTGMAKGIYFYRISDKNGTEAGAGKIIMQ